MINIMNEYKNQDITELFPNYDNDKVFWSTITGFELIEHTILMCILYTDFINKNNNLQSYDNEVNEKIKNYLKRGFQCVNDRFECDSDVLALYGYILETYHICFVKIKALEELGISNYEIKEKGKEFKMYSCEMDNPIGKAFCVYMDKK